MERSLDRLNAVGSLVVIALASAVLASGPNSMPSPSSDGWRYGRANCGPWASICSLSGCTACCDAWHHESGYQDVTAWQDCRTYCGSIPWPGGGLCS